MAAASLLLPSLISQVPTPSSSSSSSSSSKPHTPTSALYSLSLPSCKPFSPIKNVSFPSCTSFPFLSKAPAFGPVVVPRVVLSDLEQDEEVEFSGGEEEYSPDLKLYVGNLPFSVDSAQLAGIFQRAGNVEMVEVIYDRLSGKSRGFGFVTMSSMEEVEAATQQFNGYTLEGRPLRVNSGPPPRRDGSQPKRIRASANLDAANQLYVSNLAWSVDSSALETLFSEQGKVVDAKVIYDRENGRSKGFGFVTYSTTEEADSAISSLNGTDLDGRSIRVTQAAPRPRRQF